MLYGYLASLFKIGKENAAVFPDPVSAFAITLFPYKIGGMTSCWIAVGVLYLIFSHSLKTQGDRLSLLKDILFGYISQQSKINIWCQFN